MKPKTNEPTTTRPNRATKTNHQTGYDKPVKNPTTNYPMDSHKRFCTRCLTANKGCPKTGTINPSPTCDL